MKFINYLIIILALILLFLHSHFNSNSTENYITDIVPEYQNNNSINFKNTFKTYLKNYGIIGDRPPIPPAVPVKTDFGCTNYLWDSNDRLESVCQTVDGSVQPYDEDQVFANVVGSVRQNSVI
jgi:hypothetical protein